MRAIAYLAIILCGFCSCRNVVIKEGDKLFLKMFFRKKEIIPDGSGKTYLLKKMGKMDELVLSTEDYSHFNILRKADKSFIVKEAVNEQTVNTTVYSCLPDNASEESAIFKRNGTKTIRKSELFHFERAFDRIGLFKSLASTKTDDVAIIIGHNVKGGLFLPGGDVVFFKEIEQLCLESKITPVFISCNAAKYVKGHAPQFYLNAKEAVDLADIIKTYLDSGVERAKVDQIIMNFGELIDSRKRRYFVERVSLGGGGLTAYYIKRKANKN